MIYTLGDKFHVQGVLCHVCYINNGRAWVFPIEDTPGLNNTTHFACAALDMLNEYGLDSKGTKALVVSNKECQAV